MEKTVNLNPGESRVVAFSFIPAAAKSYSVSLDGLTGSFIAHGIPTAFEVSDLVIDPVEVYVGEPVYISALVTNTGDLAGSYVVNCEVI